MFNKNLEDKVRREEIVTYYEFVHALFYNSYRLGHIVKLSEWLVTSSDKIKEWGD